MSDQLLKRIQRLVATACLAGSTGCSSFMGMHSQGYTELSSSEQPPAAAEQFSVTADATPQSAPETEYLKPLSAPDFGQAAATEAPFAPFADGPQTAVVSLQAGSEPNPFASQAAAAAESANPFASPEDPFAPSDSQSPQSAATPNPFAVDAAAANPFANDRATATDAVAPAGFEAPAGENPATVTPASHTTRWATPTFHPAEPRMPTPQQACPPCEVTIAEAGPEQALAYPDEFLYDGGDRDVPVHYNGGVMEGLDTEDTIVEFKDTHGKKRVTASNRVAVYAPRFGSVRTVSGPGIGTKVDQAAGAVDFAGVGGLNESRGIEATVAGTPAEGLRMRATASGVDVAVPASQSAQASTAAINLKVDQGFESHARTGPGTLEMTDIRTLSLQIVEAATSTLRDAQVQTTGSTQATQTYATFRPQVTIGVEDNARKGEIFLTKTATPLIAQPGDTVSFTIQFRNLGDLPVGDVRIIDNLTPRLAYATGTGQITVSTGGGGSLTVVPNNEGSQMVEFQLDQPLPGGATGTITFDALVR